MLTIPREPRPRLDAVRDALAALAAKRGEFPRPDDLDARDPRFIARVLPLLGLLYDDYFRCETEIEAEIPAGPFLAVANHNAMTGTPDMFCHMVAFWRRYGTVRPAYGLMHDVPFHFPYAGAWLNAGGAIAANPENARHALARGAAVLVFPGGDVDACKPTREQYSIRFGRRRGFLRLALREQVPIVPVVSVGAHQSLYIATDGRRIAERLRLPDLVRSNVAPIGLALPWGLILGVPLPHLPPPVKVHTRILRPIRFDLPPEAADAPGMVEEAFERVVGVMQAALDTLRAEGRHGMFPRKGSGSGRSADGHPDGRDGESSTRGRTPAAR
ncbi:1-acyl-sn-glycerol-3-phosphate acyltransferase [Chondromyces apiculatus]|uniref:1-acyl-sn-glycerol-3-phosphate acyltransferase n=1 Tax=Chondromyces apiculatus DSM 436 TaxID=1192034 RepID=A0A017TFE0_9BACT|nr:1-acyl-sn-glycerol-3-phosphate acyltransferase [Chondromyces apiculatus]EYF07959.1 1-acyl-sn-glycerol-3-phosphate acyltransferase [Chondromyces apiculatus DSM 436]